MANVALTKTKCFSEEEIGEAVSRALDLLNYDLKSTIDSVVIKPNLCYYWDFSTGETTDPRVVSAVIDWIRQRVGTDVCVLVGEADASAMRTRYAFKMLGYEKLSQEKHVKLVNLSEGEIVEKEAVVAEEKFVLPVNRILLDADMIVNVPKIKSHRTIGFSCGLKNMFGAIAKPRKYAYHTRLAQTIVGINKIVKTHIALLDGIVVAGKTPKKTGVIVASDDVLAADFVAAEAMGHKPFAISYLRLAAREKVGNAKNLRIAENGITLDDMKKEFPKQNYFLRGLSWNIQLNMLRAYSKMARDVIPPILEA